MSLTRTKQLDILANIHECDANGFDVVAEAAKGDFRKVLAHGRQIASISVGNKEVQDILETERFDAVVSEWFFSDVNAGLAAALQVPWILLSGTVMNPHMESMVDDIRTVPLLPSMMLEYPVPMTLLQRMVNLAVIAGMTFGACRDQAHNEELYYQLFEPIARARGVSLPPYQEALYNVSILLSNSHPASASLPPNVIEDLQNLLDSSPNGVVYFSMGSVVKSSALQPAVREDLIRILGALPCTVLWKFEEPIEGRPKNVHIRAWMPQQSILAHPKVRLFITHGGMLSTLEALNAGVALLAIPVYAQEAGYARSVPYQPWSADALKKTLQEMLSNDSYHKTVNRLSKMFHSRPVAPSKLISHYVEVSIETQGAYHLRSPARHYAWYQRYVLDLLAVFLTVLYIFVKIFKVAFRILKNLVVGSAKTTDGNSKTKNKRIKAQ